MESHIHMTEEKKQLVVKKMEEMKARERELKAYAKKLYKNVECSLSNLFEKLNVTIVGGVQSL